MESALYGALKTYSYYNSPYQKSNEWVRSDTLAASLLTFPTPRMLKKSTREPESFKFYKYLGPQNIFYSHTTNEKMMRNMSRRQTDVSIHAITSDNIFPTQED
jgi:hypothetical protein